MPNDFGKMLEENSSVGGVGSGNWYRWNSKATTDECRSLDIRRFHRERLLKPGYRFSWSWRRAERKVASIDVLVYRDHLILSYRYRRSGEEWEDVREPVPLRWTPCNFGGEKSWFICPGAGCGRRVAVLYKPNRYFLCRHCYDLAYQSQRDNKVYRALHRAQDIRRRLGGSANMMEPFPKKPKGMHWSTYDPLWWEHHEAEMEQLVGMREWLDKMERRVG